TPPSAAPATSAPATPRATSSKPEIPTNGQIVMIDPEGKRYTFTKMAQLAAAMRAGMGKNPQPGFCEKSYRLGVEGGGSFPAGREGFMAACLDGWRKSERWLRQGKP
ncbi:hypothetical protein GWI34_27845, partial [Actinomadura sp. DSM 109109]|nr:hypothetical protein [Actinomadura lepetitiana]